MALIVYLGMVFAILWIIDTIQTIKITRKYGIGAEENVFARFLLKHGDADFAAFKALDFAVISAILYLISKRHETVATYLLVAFTIFYAATIIHNLRVYSKSFKNI